MLPKLLVGTRVKSIFRNCARKFAGFHSEIKKDQEAVKNSGGENGSSSQY
jgi:hypothetical protein